MDIGIFKPFPLLNIKFCSDIPCRKLPLDLISLNV